jgi:hypothetical protein
MVIGKSSVLAAGLILLNALVGVSVVNAREHRFELRCVVEGTPAKVVEDNSLDTPARAQYLDGQRTIAVSPKLTEGLPAVVQTFLVAHECGHLIISPTLSAAYHQRINPDRERVADRIGIRMLRDQLKFTWKQAQTIAAAFRDTKGSLPAYLPGPEREKWILACFGTTNLNCSK